MNACFQTDCCYGQGTGINAKHFQSNDAISKKKKRKKNVDAGVALW